MLKGKKNKFKVFCIGLNKTGTTTIESVLKDFQIQIRRSNSRRIIVRSLA